MPLLSDRSIGLSVSNGELTITPYRGEHMQPASYDVHLGSRLLLPVPPRQLTLWDSVKYALGFHVERPKLHYDPLADTQPMREHRLFEREQEDRWGDGGFWLPPGGVALGHTQETLTLDPDTRIAADIAGCSSLGRWFLFVHVTAGFVDPGWNGQLTLELYNASPWHLRLWEGMRIAQLRFYELDMYCERTYDKIGSYAGSVGPVSSRYTT